MNIKDWGALAGLVGAIVGGSIWIYKKAIRPVVKFFKRFDDVEKASSGVHERLSYLDKKMDAGFMLNRDAMFVASSEGLCVLANTALCELFGSTEQQMMGLGWSNFIILEDREKAWKNWEFNIKNGMGEIKDTYRIKNGENGEIINIEYHAIISRGNKEMIVGVGKAYKK